MEELDSDQISYGLDYAGNRKRRFGSALHGFGAIVVGDVSHLEVRKRGTTKEIFTQTGFGRNDGLLWLDRNPITVPTEEALLPISKIWETIIF